MLSKSVQLRSSNLDAMDLIFRSFFEIAIALEEWSFSVQIGPSENLLSTTVDGKSRLSGVFRILVYSTVFEMLENGTEQVTVITNV